MRPFTLFSLVLALALRAAAPAAAQGDTVSRYRIPNVLDGDEEDAGSGLTGPPSRGGR